MCYCRLVIKLEIYRRQGKREHLACHTGTKQYCITVLAVLKFPDPMIAHLFFFFLVPSCMLCFKKHHGSVLLLPVQIPENWIWHKSYPWPHLFIKTFRDRDSKCSKWRQLFFFLFLCTSVLSNIFLLYFWNSQAFPATSWSVLPVSCRTWLSFVKHFQKQSQVHWWEFSIRASFSWCRLYNNWVKSLLHFGVSLKPAD